MTGSYAATDTAVQNATALLTLTPKTRQTAFLISHDGLVASAGHGFDAIKAQLGATFSIEFTGRGAQAATLIAYEYVDTEGVDYALLRIETVDHALAPIRISSRTRSVLKKPFLAFGYRSGAQTVLTQASGVVKGKAPFRTGQGHYLELLTQNGSLAGMSGAAVCARRDLVAYAIQAAQISSSQSTAFATTFEAVRRRSRDVDLLIRSQTEPLDLDHDLFAKLPANNAPLARGNVLLLPRANRSTFDDDLLQQVSSRWTWFTDSVDTVCERISWLRRRPYRATLRVDKLLLNAPVPPANFWSLVSAAGLSVGRNEIRAVADLSGTIVPLETTDVDPNQGSHLVGISVLDTVDALSPSDATFDARFVIARDSPESAADKILTVLQDVFVDLFVFNSIPIVRQLYYNIDERRAFSRAKVVFARENGLRPYGMPWPQDDVRYVSFRACSRTTVSSAVDERTYHEIWGKFVNTFLFSSLGERDSNVTPTLAPDDVVARVTKLPKLYGQVSPTRIHSQLIAAGLLDGELCALAFASRRPHLFDVRDAMASFFGRRRWTANMSRVVGREQLKEVLRFSDFVKLYFFRFRRPPQATQ